MNSSRYRLFIKVLCAATATLALSCGAPFSSGPYNWTTLFRFPGGSHEIEAIAADGETLFFPDHTGGAALIKRYENGRVETVFAVELKGANSASVDDIAIAAGSGWAVGYREIPAGDDWRLEPFLIEYDGREWREVDVEGIIPPGVPSAIAVIDRESFWFLLREGTYGGLDAPALWKYDGGEVLEYPPVKSNVRRSNTLAVAYDDYAGVTYAAVVCKGGYDIFISEDLGAGWHSEQGKLVTSNPEFYPYEIFLSARGNALYIAYNGHAEFEPVPYFGGVICCRTGGPDLGTYEPLLYCPYGPNFASFGALAVNDRREISAVGGRASAYYDGSNFTLESLPNNNSFYDVTVGDAGFYAVANHEAGFLEILRHP
jgi:hypothetical protein